MTEADFRKLILEAAIKEAGGVRSLAQRLGCAPSYLSDAMNGRRGIGPAILGPLGYVGTWRYSIDAARPAAGGGRT